jgi:hypothetical protein
MTTKDRRKHAFSVQVIDRDEHGEATQWGGRCSCGPIFAAPTFEAVDDKYRRHIYDLTGKAPEPFGQDNGTRWQPAAADLASGAES